MSVSAMLLVLLLIALIAYGFEFGCHRATLRSLKEACVAWRESTADFVHISETWALEMRESNDPAMRKLGADILRDVVESRDLLDSERERV